MCVCVCLIMSLCMSWEIIASLAGFFTYAQSRNGWNYSNEILHIESLAGCSDIFETASKLVQGFGTGGVHFSVFPLTLALASNTVILESPWKVLELFVSTAVTWLICFNCCMNPALPTQLFNATVTRDAISSSEYVRTYLAVELATSRPTGQQPPSSIRQHLSYDDCLEDNMEDYPNCSVQLAFQSNLYHSSSDRKSRCW